MLAHLTTAAAENGRSVAEEVEARLEWTFTVDRLLADNLTLRLRSANTYAGKK